jgi:SRSO17 transposase
VEFATKPELALEMITDAVAAGTPAAWAASDEAYGDNGAFRAGIAKLGLGYVLAVSRPHRIRPSQAANAGCAPITSPPRCPRCWHRISAGTGSKGPRWYDWAWASAH